MLPVRATVLVTVLLVMLDFLYMSAVLHPGEPECLLDGRLHQVQQGMLRHALQRLMWSVCNHIASAVNVVSLSL